MQEHSSSVPGGTTTRAAAGWYAVAILFLGYLCSFVDRQVLSLLVEPLRAALSISDTQIALLQGLAFGVFFSVMGLPCGWLLDRYSRRLILCGGIALWSIATALCGFAVGFWSLFVARMLVGVGEATMSPGALSLISDLFPRERRALPLGVFVSAAAVGTGIALIAGGAAIAYSMQHPITLPGYGPLEGWRSTFVLVGAPGLAIAALMLTVREPTRARGAEVAAPSFRMAWALLVERRSLFLNYFGGFTLFSWLAYAVASWTATYFIRVHGWSLPQVGWRFGLIYLLCGASGAASSGFFARALSRHYADANLRTAALALAIQIVPFIAAPLCPNPWLALALFGVAIFLQSFASGASAAAVTETTPPYLRGQVVAAYYAVMSIVGLTCGPLSVALVTDYVFGDPTKIGWSMAIVSAVIAPTSAWLTWRSLGAFRRYRAADAGFD